MTTAARRTSTIVAVVALAAVLVACGPRWPKRSTLAVAVAPGGLRLTWPAAAPTAEGRAIASYRVAVDGTEVAALEATDRGCLLSGLPLGVHVVTLTAADDAGELSTDWNDGGTLTASIDVTAAPIGPPTCRPGAIRRVATGDASQLQLSADGRTLIAGARWAPVQVIDVATGTTTTLPWRGGWTVSTDGRWFTVESSEQLTEDDTDSRIDVYRWDRRTGIYELISTGPDPAFFASISPAGDAIVYLSQVGGGDVRQVWRWRQGQGAPVQLAQTTVDTVPTQISDGGATTVWTDYFGTSMIHTDERGARLLGDAAAIDISPVLSADGSTAYACYIPKHPRTSFPLLRVDVASGATTELGDGAPGQCWLSTVPDGSSVWFESDDALVPGDADGTTDLYRWSEDGGFELLLAGADRSGYRPSASADGRTLAFVSSSNNLVADDSGNTLDVFVWQR